MRVDRSLAWVSLGSEQKFDARRALLHAICVVPPHARIALTDGGYTGFGVGGANRSAPTTVRAAPSADVRILREIYQVVTFATAAMSRRCDVTLAKGAGFLPPTQRHTSPANLKAGLFFAPAARANKRRVVEASTRTLTWRPSANYEPARAQVAELVDALVSGTSGASREGSSPFLGTNQLRFS
jgi:hypothetical protein